MHTPFLRRFRFEFTHTESLIQLRERLLKILLVCSFVSGVVMYGMALFSLARQWMPDLFAVYSILFLWLCALTFLKRIPYLIRVVGWLLLFYALGFLDLLLSGFNVDAGLLFLALIALSTILVGLRGAVIALALSSLTIFGLGFHTVAGAGSLRLGLPQADPLLWIIGGTIFLFTSLVLIISMTILVRGLDEKLMKAKKLAKKLERVNEELRTAKAKLERVVDQQAVDLQASSERLRQLVLRGPAVIFSAPLSGASGFSFVSENVFNQLGYEADQFIQDPDFWMNHIHPEDVQGVVSERKQGKDRGSSTCEYRFLHQDGAYHWLHEDSKFVEGLGQGSAEMVGSWMDVTRQKQTALLLLESEKLNRLLVEATEVSVFLIDPQGILLVLNKAVADRFGRPVEELIGASVYDYLPPSFRDSRQGLVDEVVRSGKAARFEDSWGGRNIEYNLYPVEDEYGDVSRIAVFAVDITERKRAEASLVKAKTILERQVADRTKQLKLLNQKLVTAQEAERMRISRELHDEAGQALVGLRLSLGALLDEIPASQGDMRLRLSEAVDSVSQTMSKVRALAHSLRPPVLDVMGLNAILQDYCSEFSERAGIPVKYTGQEVNFPDEVKVCLYRFVQEALTNVAKHARASRVTIQLGYRQGLAALTVKDNGVGMKPDSPSQGVGLLGIKERLDLLGGRLSVRSSGRGTLLTATLPSQEQPGQP